MRLRRGGEGPATRARRPREEEQDAERERAQPEEYDGPVGRSEDKNPARQRDEVRQGVEPDAIGTFGVWLATAQKRERGYLSDELHEYARPDERVYHHPEREEAARD